MRRSGGGQTQRKTASAQTSEIASRRPERRAHDAEPGEEDEGAAEERDEQAVAARRVEAEDAVPRRAAGRGALPDRHRRRWQSAMKAKNAAVGQVQAIHERRRCCRVVSSDPAEGEALGDVVAHEIDDDGAGDDGQRAGGGEQAELVAGGARRFASSSRRSAWRRPTVSVLARSSSTQENMKQKKAATPMPAAMVGMKMRDEEAREGIAVDIGGLVELLRHAGHEALENPHRERDVEEGVGERHGDVACRTGRPPNRAGRRAGRRPPPAPCGWSAARRTGACRRGSGSARRHRRRAAPR